MSNLISKEEQNRKTLINFQVALNKRGRFSSRFKESSEEDVVLLNLYKMAYPLNTLSGQLNLRSETNLYVSLFSQAVTDSSFLNKLLKSTGDTKFYRIDLCWDFKKDKDMDYLFIDGLLKPESKNNQGIRAIESFRELWKACNESQRQMILKKECSMLFQVDYVFVKHSLKEYLLSSMSDKFKPCKSWDDFWKRSSENNIKSEVLSDNDIQRFIPALEKKFGFSATSIFSSSAYDSANGFSLFQTIEKKACDDLNFKEQNLLDNVKLEFDELVANGVPEYPIDNMYVPFNKDEVARQFSLYENIERWMYMRMSMSQRFDEPFTFTKEEFATLIEIDKQKEKFNKRSGTSNYISMRGDGNIFQHMPQELLDNHKEDMFCAYLNAKDDNLKANLGELVKKLPLADIFSVQESLKVKFPSLNTYSPLVEKLILDEKIAKSTNNISDSSLDSTSRTFKL